MRPQRKNFYRGDRSPREEAQFQLDVEREKKAILEQEKRGKTLMQMSDDEYAAYVRYDEMGTH